MSSLSIFQLLAKKESVLSRVKKANLTYFFKINTYLKSIFWVIFLTLFSFNLLAQKIQNLVIPTDGSIVLSEKTDTLKTYVITVEGIYSMWPREGTTECYGVDAVYIYDVPKGEMENWRWPPDSIEVPGLGKIPFFVLPKWVGDPQIFEVPPRQISVPEFSISLRKYTGFRIDGEPLPNVGFNWINHSYTIEKKGTGEPFSFQILDSNYNILMEKIIPRFEDNCGYLRVKIEEKAEDTPTVEICGIEGICDSNSVLIGLRVWSRIFEQDTSNPTGLRNILNNVNPSQISVIEDGVFKCDVDIKCENLEGIAVGLLVDVSPSMDLNIRPGDFTRRIDATKGALKKFVSTLSEKDSVFLMSFSSGVYLNQDWTNDKNQLTSEIDKLDTVPSKTALFKAIIDALDKINQSSLSSRYLLVLSDGANTVPYPEGYPDDSIYLNTGILNDIKRKSNKIPIYFVALGFGKNDTIGIHQLETIAKSTFGKVNYIYDEEGLNSIYSNFKSIIDENACCEIYFNIDPCQKGERKYIRLLFSPSDTLLLTKIISFNCDTCIIVSSVDIREFEIQSIQDVNVYPNPTRDITKFEYFISKAASVKIILTDLKGNVINDFSTFQEIPGKYYHSIDLKELPNGTYFLSLFIDNKLLTKKVLILR